MYQHAPNPTTHPDHIDVFCYDFVRINHKICRKVTYLTYDIGESKMQCEQNMWWIGSSKYRKISDFIVV